MWIDWKFLECLFIKGWYKKWKIEKWFQAEIFSILRSMWYICFHVQDIWLAYKFLDGHIIDQSWNLSWIEFKKIKWDTFNVSQFEHSQIILLKELEKRNDKIARVFIYSEKHNKYKVFKFSELWDNKNDRGGIKIWNKDNI